MKIAEIWRYPVKSMQGERLAETELTPRGIDGDRVYAVKTAAGRIASAKNARRFGRLFECGSRGDHGTITIFLPTGEFPIGEADEPLSAFLGEPVGLSPDAPAETETEIDYLDLDDAELKFPPMAGTFFDTTPLHVLFTSELEMLTQMLVGSNLDVRRFRPNILIEGSPAGSTLTVGDAEILIEGPCPRCIMTTLPQPGGIPRDVEVLKTIARETSGNFGWLGRTLRPGTIREGDAVR